jgi:hypothetical protein
MRELDKPMNDLGAQMEKHGREMERLGEQMTECVDRAPSADARVDRQRDRQRRVAAGEISRAFNMRTGKSLFLERPARYAE